MFATLPDPIEALAFYALALAMGVALALAPNPSTFVYMFTPLVAALLVMLVLGREGWSRAGWARLGLHRPGARLWGRAVGVPLVVVGGAFAVLWATGLADLAVPAEVEGFETGAGFWLLFPLLMVANLAFTTVTNSLGEELGWRGYLLPRLESFGTVPALVLTGLAHALWHLPVMLLTTLYHAEGERAIVLPLFVVTLALAGIFMGALRLESGSVWPAALAHGTHNLVWAIAALFTVPGDAPLAVEYLAGDSGLLVAIGYGVAAAWIVTRSRVRRERAAA